LLGSVVRIDRLHHHAFDLRHGENALYKSEELDFAQHLHQRGHALDSRAAGDQAMRPRGAFSLFVILLPVAKALVFVLFSHELLLSSGLLDLQFFEFRTWFIHSDGVYKLLSHGRSVKPCDVSVGERNIIGLSYFFTSILEGREEQNAYGEEYLIIIDDPVSSYDMENKIGILSFLKYKLSVFLEGNPNTKALIMTHDLTTLYDLQKIFEEIMDVCKQKGYPHGPKFSSFELQEGIIKPFFNRRQEYTEILKTIYVYASEQSNDCELIIGNMMRQALEAFSTFEYKKGIEDVSTDTKILDLLPEPKYVVYYKNLMYRLVLHGGSHKEEQIKAMKDFHFFSLISEAEKKRTAKDILCFIYLLNKRHLLEHLKECGDVEGKLQSWCQDIKTRASVI